MTFKGLLHHVGEIRALALAYPSTKVIIDHFGFCKASNPHSDEWQALLSLAELPQVYVKVGHVFCFLAFLCVHVPSLLILVVLPDAVRLCCSADWLIPAVQTSAFFRISSQEYPYEDTHACIRLLISAFGAQRLMWGSDFPWVTEKCGYTKAWDILPDTCLSDEEASWIMGGTISTLLPFAQKAVQAQV
jgi:predicted TIM-barrel fold metal-dependent hydrolase